MNEALLEKVLASPRLPSLPTIALEVIELVQQRDIDIRQIASTIQMDPALASKILKTVNSSFYGQSHQISTISHALVVLGLNSVKTLALSFSRVTNLKQAGDEEFDHMAFWKRSLYTAAAARAIAKQIGLVEQEEIFLGGLMQDLGMLTLDQTLGAEYREAIAPAEGEHRKIRKLEIQQFECDHCEVGAALAERWNLPPLLIAPIRYHEIPAKAPQEVAKIVQCVAVGNRVADVFMENLEGKPLDAYYRMVHDWFALTPDRAEPLLKEIHRDTVEMRRLFDLPTGGLGNPDDILARANETLLNISLEQQQEAQQLEQKNRELVEEVNTDSLTGVANRRRFNEFVAEQFDRVTQGDGPLSILFFDTDHFKKFNDTYGHQIGDLVLVEFARTIERTMPRDAMVARYGGEEFAAVLPGVSRSEAARFAEQVRKAIQDRKVETDEGLLSVTASIGVATYEGEVFARVEQLVKAADQAVYAAKSGGRNCVRVFVPRRVREAG